MQDKKHWRLYVLKLENGKYYVGATTKSVGTRFYEHKNNIRAAAWTRLKGHKPKQVIYEENLGYVTKEYTERCENKLVRNYIDKYGIENVRGGDISMIDDDLKYMFKRPFAALDWSALKTIVFMLIIIMLLGLISILKK